MEATLLVRLVAARHLIESSGPDLTDSSPPLLLAQKLLAAHDSSELVFFALTSLPGITPEGQDGQTIKDPSFMMLAQTVINHAAEHCAFQNGSCLKLFKDLNEARKVFKHRGILVDPDSNAHIFADVVTALDKLCGAILNKSLLQIDQTSTIILEEARERFNSARDAILASNFKLSLEHTALGLAAAFWNTATPSLSVGRPSSEEALLLLGRGIDPASFLSMQQLLPIAYYPNDEVSWNLREFGHEANCTCNVAQSCLEIAISVVAKLQAIPYRPTPIDFYEDVVKIKGASPEVYWAKSGMFSLWHEEQTISGLEVGEQVIGRASGWIERNNSLTSGMKVNLEYAVWVAIERPRTDRIQFDGKSSTINTVWVKADQVEIAHQVSQERLRLQGSFRQYLDD